MLKVPVSFDMHAELLVVGCMIHVEQIKLPIRTVLNKPPKWKVTDRSYQYTELMREESMI